MLSSTEREALRSFFNYLTVWNNDFPGPGQLTRRHSIRYMSVILNPKLINHLKKFYPELYNAAYKSRNNISSTNHSST